MYKLLIQQLVSLSPENVKMLLNTCYTGQVRAVPKLIVGGDGGLVPVLHYSSQTMLKCISKQI